MIALAGLGQAAALWAVMGGREGLAEEWPPLEGDHGFQYHQGVVTPHFLRTNGTTAGYDPSFMAGYSMSIVSLPSSTLCELVMLAAGGARPALVYKLFVLATGALLPWLMAAAAFALRAGPRAAAIAAVLYVSYLWTDYPSDYVMTGMVAYAMSVPLGLLAAAALTAYLDRGGPSRWLGAAASCAGVFLVHPMSAMLVAPAGALAYGVATFRSRRGGRTMPTSRHLGVWAILPATLAANAFWLVPGLRLMSTRGPSDVAFMHPESLLGRIGEIVWSASPIQAVLLGLAPAGLVVLARRDAVAAAGLGGILAAGFGWGYLAGAFRALDTLQPGRHTYAFFSAAAIAAGIGLGAILGRLRAAGPPRLDLWAAAGLILIAVRMFGPPALVSIHWRLTGRAPSLGSRPLSRFLWLVDRVKAHVRPGERLLYEESGLAVAGLGDPFAARHYSGVLPHVAGVEVLGGPYLHVTVKENFTQFGEGKLFGKADWGRDHFVRYAKLYRPAAIVCWTPKARAFCRNNPDLIRILDDDGALLIGRVLGFEGATIRGKAEVTAGPNRIEVRDAVASDDGLVVLRYHAVPHLRSEPPVDWEPVRLEDDPVPFIAFRPNGGTVVFSIRPAPWSP